MNGLQGRLGGMADKTIVSTFGYERSPVFTKTIQYYGGTVRHLPLLTLSLAEDLTEFDWCAKRIVKFDVVIFSSPNMVEKFFLRFDQLGLKRSWLDTCYVLSIGSETTKMLNRHCIEADGTPSQFTADRLAEMLKKNKKNWKVLIPCSDRSLWRRKNLFADTRFKVYMPTLYVNEMAETEHSEQVSTIFSNPFDGIVFTSPSGVEYLSRLYTSGSLANLLSQKVVASIGPTTSAACRDHGVSVTLEPRKHTITSLMWMLISHFENGYRQ
jgi:uroporphyrinogen-III synthase